MVKEILILILLNLFYSKISQINNRFIDQYNRTIIFHGVNVVYKIPPYIPITDKFDPFLSLNDLDIEYLKSFGFNVVRLGIIWEAVEIKPDIFDDQLLNKYLDLVNKLGQNNIYTIIDSHQDVLSRRTCGEGVPVFYIDSIEHDKDCNGSFFKKFLNLIGVCKSMAEYNYEMDKNGLPLIEECKKKMFAVYHTTPEVSSLFDKLYKNEDGFLDKFINYWLKLASVFKGNAYVIGYDILNEPYPGGVFDRPFETLIPGKPDNEQLLPFYRSVDNKIRKLDPDYTMMFEPTPFPDTLPILYWRFKGNFKDVPLKSENYNKQVYNYHSYCCSTSISICANGEPPLNKAEFCRNYHFENIELAKDYSNKFNIPSIISEFGACQDTLSCFNEINSVADASDQYLTSWIYWMYKPFNDFTTSCPDDKEGLFYLDGSIQKYKIEALTRSYAQAFQGEAKKMNFDIKTGILLLEYLVDVSIKEPTIIYINKELKYKNGVDVYVETAGIFEIDESENNKLKIIIKGDENMEKFVLVKISPK